MGSAPATAPVPARRVLEGWLVSSLVALGAVSSLEAQPASTTARSSEASSRGSSAEAQANLEAYRGREIEAILYEGLETLSTESLNHYLQLEENARFDPEILNDGIHRLWRTGLIDDLEVQIEPHEASGGLTLVLRVEEKSSIQELDFQGVSLSTREALKEQLSRRGIEVSRDGKLASPIDRSGLHEIELLLAELVQAEGFVGAMVHSEIDCHADAACRAILALDKGERLLATEVDFVGNTAESDEQLRRVLREILRLPWWRRWASPERPRGLEPAAIERDLERLRQHYRDRGYKDVEIGEPELELADTSSPEEHRVRLVIPVHEGRRFKLGEVSVSGNHVFSDERLRAELELQHGDWLDGSAIEQARTDIGELYATQGYLQVVVETAFGDTGEESDLEISIDEGEQYRIGRVDLHGNTRTRDATVRRELGLDEGEVFDAQELRRGLRSLASQGFVELSPEEPVDLEIDEGSERVDLDVRLREKDIFYPELSGGYGHSSGFRLRGSLRVLNPFGFGESFGVAIEEGELESGSRLWGRWPSLYAGTDLLFEAFERNRTFELLSDGAERRERGGRLQARHRLNEAMALSVSLSSLAERDVLSDAQGESRRQRRTVGVGFVRDTQDSLFEPTKGQRLFASLDYEGAALGSDLSLLKSTLGFVDTESFGGRTLATALRFRVEGGWLEELENADAALPALDRFFLGGDDVRGYAPRSIWLRDPQTSLTLFDDSGVVRGGDGYLKASLEFHLIPRGPLRVLLFSDMAQPFDARRSPSLDSVRASAGIELRFYLPKVGVPLRLIYAENLDPLRGLPAAEEERFDNLTFGIGTSF